VLSAPQGRQAEGVVEAPKPSDGEDYDKTFVKVEIESEYPGGAPACSISEQKFPVS